MAKRTLNLSEVSSSQYIQQIAALDGTYDVVPAHKITFFDGQSDVSGVEWDGVRDLEVVIPSLTDLIQDPIRFAGTVGSDGIPKSGDTAITPAKGDLIFFTADVAAFETVSGTTIACEAGDMAVYDGTKWCVVSGENQVTINAAAATVSGNDNLFTLTGTAKTLFTVEGKSLSVKIDYADVRSKIGVTTNAANTLDVINGTVTVAPKYIGLSQAEGSTVDITKSVSISLPTALADGGVTISQNVLEASNFVFTSGAYPTITKNSEAISVSTSHSMTIAASGDGDFVTNVTAIKGVSFVSATSASNDLAFVTNLSSSDGASFVNGIHVKASDENAVPDLSLWGQVTVGTSTFATGFGAAAASGDVVSSITVGAVSLVEGSDILTGLSGGGDSVLTAVSFGTLGVDADKSWFYSGLGEGNDVVTGVSLGAISLVSDSSSEFAASAVTAATVSNHVLTFTTGSFMTPVAISKAADTITKGGFTKSGVQLSGANTTSVAFTKKALNQADTAISYKSLTTDNVTLSQSSTEYVFGKAASTVYSPVMGYVNISVTDATVSKNGAVIENPTITATIPSNQVAVDVTAGTLPTFAVNTATGVLTGSVGTSLSTSNVSWLAVDASMKDIAIAGAYSLIEDASTFTGAVEVANASTYGISGATATIAEGTFVDGVYVDGTKVTEVSLSE